MSRVLLAFFNAVQDKSNPTVVPCFYESFIKELESLGNIVMAIHHSYFASEFPRVPTKLKNIISTFTPDFAILFNNSFFDISKDFDFPIIIYETDSIKYWSNKDILKNNINRFRYVACQTETIDVLHKQLNIDKKYISYASFFTSVKNENIKKTMNICFIGNRFFIQDKRGFFPWNRFMQQNPTRDMIDTFKSFIYEIQKYPQYEKEIINKYHSTKFNIKPLTDDCDLLMSLSSYKRETILAQIADLGLTIYGPKDWITCNCSEMDVVLSYNPKQVYSLKHNQDIYNQSRIAININHIQANSGFSWRVCDILASNAVLISEYSPDFDILFPNIPIQIYKNKYDVRNLCKKLLSNKSMCEDIVLQCNEIIEQKFRFKHIIKKIEQFSNVNFMNNKIKKNHRTFFIAI